MGEKGKRRRTELLKIAYRLFIQRGYGQTSVDDIIAEAQIAKGTYYYYFPSKEATLEAVIDMMLSQESARAQAVAEMPIPVPQKIVGIIGSFQPQQEELALAQAPEVRGDAVMNDRIRRRIIDEATPVLARVIEQGIDQGIFSCDHVKERVRIIMIVSDSLFNGSGHTAADIEVFVDIVEKLLGAEPGTMEFVKGLIH